jgi:hypothetical protein
LIAHWLLSRYDTSDIMSLLSLTSSTPKRVDVARGSNVLLRDVDISLQDSDTVVSRLRAMRRYPALFSHTLFTIFVPWYHQDLP